jgi:hypothetical protein
MARIEQRDDRLSARIVEQVENRFVTGPIWPAAWSSCTENQAMKMLFGIAAASTLS